MLSHLTAFFTLDTEPGSPVFTVFSLNNAIPWAGPFQVLCAGSGVRRCASGPHP